MIADEAASRLSGPAAPVAPAATSILLAEDHTLVRSGIRALLEGLPDLRVIGEVSDGRLAVEACRKLNPQLVLMDVAMPEMNGIDVAKAILHIKPQCRIILFSGQPASVDLLEQAKVEGFQFEILAKPVNPDRLLFVLDEKRYSATSRKVL